MDVDGFVANHVKGAGSTAEPDGSCNDATQPGAASSEGDGNPASGSGKQELATFRLLYETSRLCLFETRDGRITVVRSARLA